MKNMFIALALIVLAGCGQRSVQSVSGANATSAGKISLGSDGLSVEQRNIKERIQQDNKPGAIKHLYVISAYSGQCIFYSTVRGKVTSSSKRLLPDDLREYGTADVDLIESDGRQYTTSTLPGEDGTYGNSMPYLYWWDMKGVYHQHYVEGGANCACFV